MDDLDTRACKNKCGALIDDSVYYKGDGCCSSVCSSELAQASRRYNHIYAKESDPLKRFEDEIQTWEDVKYGGIRMTRTEFEQAKIRQAAKLKVWEEMRQQQT